MGLEKDRYRVWERDKDERKRESTKSFVLEILMKEGEKIKKEIEGKGKRNGEEKRKRNEI